MEGVALVACNHWGPQAKEVSWSSTHSMKIEVPEWDACVAC